MTWRSVFKENKILIPIPNGWDPDQAITSGEISRTAQSVLLAYFPEGNADSSDDFYFLWRYDLAKKTWKTGKVIGDDGGSIVGVQDWLGGFLVTHHGHLHNLIGVIGQDLKPLFSFIGGEVNGLPNGNIYDQDSEGFPCIMSVISFEGDTSQIGHLPGSICLLDRGDPNFQGFIPLIDGHVFYNSSLGIFGARISAREHVDFGRDDGYDSPEKFKIFVLIVQDGTNTFQRYFMDMPFELEKSGDGGLEEFMKTKSLSTLLLSRGIKFNPPHAQEGFGEVMELGEVE